MHVSRDDSVLGPLCEDSRLLQPRLLPIRRTAQALQESLLRDLLSPVQLFHRISWTGDCLRVLARVPVVPKCRQRLLAPALAVFPRWRMHVAGVRGRCCVSVLLFARE